MKTLSRQSKRVDEYVTRNNVFNDFFGDADNDAVKNFRPSSKVVLDEPIDQFDENGNSPWAPRPKPKPSITFENDDDAYDVNDEYYYDPDDVDGTFQQREDDDESVRVAVWLDPSLKSNMGGLASGFNKLMRGSSKRTRAKKKKPTSGTNNGNKLKSFITNLIPNNNNNNNYGGGSSGGQGFKLPNLSNLIPKGQNNQNQYGQSQAPKLPSLPKLPKLPNPFKGSTTKKPSSSYGTPSTGTLTPSPGYGAPSSARPAKKQKKKARTTRRPNVNTSTKVLPSAPPDFVFGPPIRLTHQLHYFIDLVQRKQ